MKATSGGASVRAVRKSFFLFTAAALALSGAMGTAAAQDAGSEDEVITVTGSRIQRPDYQFTNPVVSATAQSIESSGATSLTNYLESIPALTNSLDSTEAFPGSGFTGLDLLSLRNLGTQRTLVLVNGRRHIAGGTDSAGVDINTIPQALIERVDVLTGGASAVYGADGVSGVVNFILKDDFEGLRVSGELGRAEAEGAENEQWSVTFGSNFDNGRGNIAGSVEYENRGRLTAWQRAYAGVNETRFVVNPDPAGFRRIPLQNLVWFESGRGGAVYSGLNVYDGTTDNLWDYGTPGFEFLNGGTYSQGGSGTPTGGYTETLLPAVEVFSINLFGHYDLSPNVRLFSEFKYVTNHAFNLIQPNFDYYLAFRDDNFFLPPNIAADLAANGSYFGGYDPIYGDLAFMSRDHFDLGVQGEDITRDTLRGVIGIEGDLTDHMQFNVSAIASTVNIRNVTDNAIFFDRFVAAIDAVDDGFGNPVCRIQVDPGAQLLDFNVQERLNFFGFLQNFPTPQSFAPSECVPLNLFGDGSPSIAARDFVTGDLEEKDRLTQQVFTAFISGDTGNFLNLPGGALGYAFGAEWRRESLSAIPDAATQAGYTSSGEVSIGGGSFEVREFFIEFDAPILKDAPFADSLSLDAAYRLSEYSTIGDTTTWKVGIEWAPISDLTFRATTAEAVRAPNIIELFGPAVVTYNFITDPCRPDQWALGPDPALRQANCEILLNAAGVTPDPTAYVDGAVAFTKRGQATGNSSLDEEEATTNTWGVIFRPRFLPGFTFSVDHYDIELTGAIRLLDAQDIADSCVDAPTVVNDFCALITRQVGGGSPGTITNFIVQPENVAAYTTAGYDFTASYGVSPSDDWNWGGDWGHFDFRLIGNKLEELEFVNVVGGAPDDGVGELAERAPEWQVFFQANWERGPLSLAYGYNWFSELTRYNRTPATLAPNFVDPQFRYIDGRSTHDVQARFRFTDWFEVYGGVNNLGDQQPGLSAGSYPVNQVGRFFYLGATATFGAP